MEIRFEPRGIELEYISALHRLHQQFTERPHQCINAVRRIPLARTDFGSARFRFARDSPLEGDGFELPVPRELGLRRGRRLALYLGSLTLRRRGPDWNATKRRRDSERRASTAAE